MGLLDFLKKPVAAVTGTGTGNFTLPGLKPAAPTPAIFTAPSPGNALTNLVSKVAPSVFNPLITAQQSAQNVIDAGKKIAPAITKSIAQPPANLILGKPGQPAPVMKAVDETFKFVDAAIGAPVQIASKLTGNGNQPEGLSNQFELNFSNLLKDLKVPENIANKSGKVLGFMAGLAEPVGEFGDIEFLPKGVAAKIARSTDVVEISALLQRHIPDLKPEAADVLAKPLAHINSPEAVKSLLNGIHFQAQKIAKAKADASAVSNIDQSKVRDVTATGEEAPKTTSPMDFIKKPVSEVVGETAPTTATPPQSPLDFIKKPVKDVIAEATKPEIKPLSDSSEQVTTQKPEQFLGTGNRVAFVAKDGNVISTVPDLQDQMVSENRNAYSHDELAALIDNKVPKGSRMNHPVDNGIRISNDKAGLSIEVSSTPTQSQFESLKKLAGDRTVFFDIVDTSGKDFETKILKSGQGSFDDFYKAVNQSSNPLSSLKEEAKSQKFKEFLNRSATRQAFEAKGQEVLDNLSEKNVAPSDVAHKFWTETYDKLPEVARENFNRLLNAQGNRPGEVFYTTKEGKQMIPKDHKELGIMSADTYGGSIESLEGSERGYVAMMDEANRAYTQATKEAPTVVKSDIQEKPVTSTPDNTTITESKNPARDAFSDNRTVDEKIAKEATKYNTPDDYKQSLQNRLKSLETVAKTSPGDLVISRAITSIKEKIASVDSLPKEIFRNPDIESISNRGIKNPVADKLEEEVHNINLERSILRDAINKNPAQELKKYLKDGALPEVTGRSKNDLTKRQNEYAVRGDDIADELGFNSTDEANDALADLIQKESQYKDLLTRGRATAKDLLNARKEDIDAKSLSQFLKDSFADQGTEYHEASVIEDAVKQGYDPEITKRNGGVTPPKARGGIKAPELDLTSWKDKNAALLTRETMERNIDDIAPKKDAQEIKDFLIDHVRSNEMAKAKFVNKQFKDIREKLGSLNIRRSNKLKTSGWTKDDALVQLFGEGKISLTELQKATKNWINVQKAADFTSKLYDFLLDDWNNTRAEFGYKPVPRRKNYFRHMKDINQWTNDFGILLRPSDLPTEISGITDDFKPGKQFTNAELRRKGDKTSYSVIEGLENYIKSVSEQKFHIDSIQRGRALENYIRKAAEATNENFDKVKLPHFVANLNEWTNKVAGKASRIDRGVEQYMGRNMTGFTQALTRRFGANTVAGNISSAITNFIPLATNLATNEKLAIMKAAMRASTAPFTEGFNTVDGVESSFLTRRFPEKHIDADTFESTGKFVGWLFESIDKFTSKTVVGSKYYEGLDAGLTPEEAMKAADDYASRIISDRAKGEMPNLFNSKTLGFLTQFQLEVNNSISTVLKDIPKWASDSPHKRLKVLSMLVQLAVYTYIFNEVYERVRGSRATFDPLYYILGLAGVGHDFVGKKFKDRAGEVGAEAARQLPFGNLAFGGGRFPTQQIFTDAAKVFTPKSWSDFGLKLAKVAADVGSPVGGGMQIWKTGNGIYDYLHGNYQSGKTNLPIKKNIPNALRAGLFGPSSFPEVRDFYNKVKSPVVANPNSKIKGLLKGKIKKTQGLNLKASKSSVKGLLKGKKKKSVIKI